MKIRITQSIFFLLAIALIFLYVNPPFAEVKEWSEYQLLFVGAAGTIFILFLQKELKSFEVKNKRDLFGDFAVGTALGGFSFVLVNFILGATKGIMNLLGVMSLQAASANDASLLFVVEIVPLVETILLVGGVLVLAKILRSVKIPLPSIVAAVAIMLIFAAFHFNVAGKAYYEYSGAGFINFIGNVEGIGAKPFCGVGVQTDCVSSAFPQFLMGGIWILFALAFNSWVVAWRAHATSNLIACVLLFGLQPLLLFFCFLHVGITIVAAKKTKMKEFDTFDFKRVLE